jgi:glycosyltransferase involved in cell wall biosynthesis
MKRVLMVAFHFPPNAESSGIQRTLRFVQHLPDLGWQPVVLTAHPRAYRQTSPDLMSQVPAGTEVVRAFAFDTARHLAIGGRYPGFLALPDRWQSWQFGATWAARALLRRVPCDAIWSTYPIATAHRIGAALHRRTGLPWIADFRDPMAQDGYPPDARTWQSFKRIEEVVYANAARCVFTTPGAANEYRARYAEVPADRTIVIENGYDEETFAGVEDDPACAMPLDPGRVVLLHSGIVYPSERDPTHLMQALAILKSRGAVSPETFAVWFRGAGHTDMLTRAATAAGVLDLIRLLPSVPYDDALKEMLRADALLVLQASNCNAQIPAKLYEYLRAGRPILGLTDPVGDTAQLLSRAGIAAGAPLDSAEAIARLLERFVREPSARTQWIASSEAVRQAARRSRAVELAKVLDAATARPSPASRGFVLARGGPAAPGPTR